jgi:hypothetical protein
MLPKIYKPNNYKTNKHHRVTAKGYYLVPFESYKKSLYNASSQEMVNLLIRYSSSQCFLNIMKEPNDIDRLSEILELRRWMLLGFEIHLSSKKSTNLE